MKNALHAVRDEFMKFRVKAKGLIIIGDCPIDIAVSDIGVSAIVMGGGHVASPARPSRL
jgi:hypothetical protein